MANRKTMEIIEYIRKGYKNIINSLCNILYKKTGHLSSPGTMSLVHQMGDACDFTRSKI